MLPLVSPWQLRMQESLRPRRRHDDPLDYPLREMRDYPTTRRTISTATIFQLQKNYGYFLAALVTHGDSVA